MLTRTPWHLPTLAAAMLAAACTRPTPAVATATAPPAAAEPVAEPAADSIAPDVAAAPAEVIAAPADAAPAPADAAPTAPDVPPPDAAPATRAFGDPQLREPPTPDEPLAPSDPFWQTPAGARVHAWPGSEDAKRVLFSADRQRVLVQGPAQAAVFDTRYGELLAILAAQNRNPLVAARLSPDGHWLVAADNVGRLHLYDIRARKLVKSWTATKVDDYIHDTGWVETYDLDLSPDGTMLASAMAPDGAVTLWELPSGRRVGVFDSGVHRVLFAPDGKTLATVGATLWFWDTATRKKRSAVLVHPRALRWLDAETVLASDNGGRRIRVADGAILDDFKDLRAQVVALALLADGRPLAIDTSTRVIVWSPDGAPQIVRELGTEVSAWGQGGDHVLALARDGSRLYLCRGGETRAVLDVVAGTEIGRAKQLTTYCEPAFLAGAGPVLLAQMTLAAWDPGAAEVVPTDPNGSNDGIDQVTLSDDGTVMLAVRGGSRVGLYGVRGVFKRRLAPCGEKNFAWSPAALSLSADGRAYATTCPKPHGPPTGKAHWGIEVARVDEDAQKLGAFDTAEDPGHLFLSPDASRLAILGPHALELRATATGEMLASVPRALRGPTLGAWSAKSDAFLYVGDDGRPTLLTLPPASH